MQKTTTTPAIQPWKLSSELFEEFDEITRLQEQRGITVAKVRETVMKTVRQAEAEVPDIFKNPNPLVAEAVATISTITEDLRRNAYHIIPSHIIQRLSNARRLISLGKVLATETPDIRCPRGKGGDDDDDGVWMDDTDLLINLLQTAKNVSFRPEVHHRHEPYPGPPSAQHREGCPMAQKTTATNLAEPLKTPLSSDRVFRDGTWDPKGQTVVEPSTKRPPIDLSKTMRPGDYV